ncbi:hypothetical protein F4679DRAFT_501494 [Xylaria curta]|nr:hypothetical protein F4679DRAFT_501494 [Xylaria curta]
MAFFGRSIRKHLVPARNSRHRTACLALYRALLRLAPQISLPDSLATAWGPGKNPIAIHIRRAFGRNVADTSPRIVYPALSAGYRMLSVLQDAATTPNSTHHASIIAFLEARLAERQRSLANRPPPPKGPKPGAPRPGTLPLLVKVSPPPSETNPYPLPRYETPHRPRPQSELGGTGRRKIPVIDMASDFPFLRLTKPEPALLGRVLRQKMEKRIKRMDALLNLKEEGLAAAKLEDNWDTAMAQLMRAEEKRKRTRRGARDTDNTVEGRLAWEDEHDVGVGEGKDGRSHAYALNQYGIKDLTKTMTWERRDEVARADAMRLLIKKEKALAAAEKEQRAVEKRAKWEAKMLELHGETWRDLFPNLKENLKESQWGKVL